MYLPKEYNFQEPNTHVIGPPLHTHTRYLTVEAVLLEAHSIGDS